MARETRRPKLMGDDEESQTTTGKTDPSTVKMMVSIRLQSEGTSSAQEKSEISMMWLTCRDPRRTEGKGGEPCSVSYVASRRRKIVFLTFVCSTSATSSSQLITIPATKQARNVLVLSKVIEPMTIERKKRKARRRGSVISFVNGPYDSTCSTAR